MERAFFVAAERCPVSAWKQIGNQIAGKDPRTRPEMAFDGHAVGARGAISDSAFRLVEPIGFL